MVAVEPDRIAAHSEVTTHVADGLAALPQQLRGREKFEALVTTYLTQSQEIESAAWDLYALAITNSSDHALDQVGAILRQPRPDGMTDTVYRKVLSGVVLAMKSSGTGDEVEEVARAMIGAYATLTETFPATMLARPASEPDVPASVLLSVLRRAKSAGVGLQVIDVGPLPRFRFSSSSEEVVASSSSGFGDSTGAVSGGELVGVVV